MNNQDKLFYAAGMMEKQANPFARFGLSALRQGFSDVAAKAPGFLDDLAGRNDFVGGLAAPVVKLLGKGQRAYGWAQQGVAAARAGGKATMQELQNSPLYMRGAQNAARGTSLRTRAGLQSGIIGEGRSLGYRAGRGLGMVGIGAPIAMAPFTLASYAGAASADPAVAAEHAKNTALQRMEDRMSQFQAMPLLERIQTAWNPEKFTSQLNMPEAGDLGTAMAENNINNPGIMKYLTSFNPFFGDPSEVIQQKVRAEMMRALGQQQAKQASMFKKLMPGIRTAWRAGRIASKNPDSLPLAVVGGKTPAWQSLINDGVYNVAKSPFTTPLTAAWAAAAPLALPGIYYSGQKSVYNQAAQDARGLVDMQMHSMFNTPGFSAGAGRFGAAVAPGFTKDMLLRTIRESMFPTQQ